MSSAGVDNKEIVSISGLEVGVYEYISEKTNIKINVFKTKLNILS